MSGDEIIEAISNGDLFAVHLWSDGASCGYDIVWSENAAEQIEAMFFKVEPNYVDLLYELDKHIEGMTEDELCTKSGRLLQEAFRALKNLK